MQEHMQAQPILGNDPLPAIAQTHAHMPEERVQQANVHARARWILHRPRRREERTPPHRPMEQPMHA